MILINQSAELLNCSHADPVMAIAQAARVCYQSKQKDRDSEIKFLKTLWQNGHYSVFEHVSFTFRLITDRGTSHELVRHRLASFSQESTRYCKYTDDLVFVVDWLVHEGVVIGSLDDLDHYIRVTGLDYMKREFLSVLYKIEDAYTDLIHAGVLPQQARQILPNALKTELIMTANLREWFHIIKLRTSPKAHPQIRDLIGQVNREITDYLKIDMPFWQ